MTDYSAAEPPRREFGIVLADSADICAEVMLLIDAMDMAEPGTPWNPPFSVTFLLVAACRGEHRLRALGRVVQAPVVPTSSGVLLRLAVHLVLEILLVPDGA